MRLSDYFETRTRDSGENFIALKDEHPKWLQEAVRDAHQGSLPNDWIYVECRAACEAIDEGDISEDETHDYADGRVDVYTKDRYQWATEMCLTDLYAAAESEAEDMGYEEHENIAHRIAVVQYHAIRSIAETMLAAWEKNKDEELEDA
jgi:hypothetical protein